MMLMVLYNDLTTDFDFVPDKLQNSGTYGALQTMVLVMQEKQPHGESV